MSTRLLGPYQSSFFVRTITKYLQGKGTAAEVVSVAFKYKWRSASNVARMEEGRWAKKASEGISQGKRGRPSQWSRNSMAAICRPLWNRAAQGRDIWEKIGEAFSQMWDQ